MKNILVSGRVQGVGFRYATKQTADDLGLKGWVKNNPDGTVQIHVTGNDNKVQEFISKIRNSPIQFAKVDDVTVTDSDNKETYQAFSIK